ncbi:MAG: LemA family protein [Veillonella sp.]|nr:LemA family protein [Veillonella sp.]
MSSLIFLLILALVIFFIKQYNTLQKLTVEIKEARANIIVAYEKKVAIINQYSGLVDEYGDYEKSIQLKVSDNFLEMARATAKAVQNITALANQFPELKADSQYGKFLEAISENETFISNKREIYNFQVKEYNSAIAQIPMVFVAAMLGFKQAPFFDPKNEEALAAFSGAPAEFKPQDKPEQSEQPTSVEELEQQVLKQNELGKSVDTEETKQDDKK